MDASAPAHTRLLAREQRILEQWEQRVRREIPAARDAPHPILIDTVPALLRKLAEALSPAHPRDKATSGDSIAEEHGGERVRLTRYRLEDVITEYKLLRRAIVEVLEEEGPLSSADQREIHDSIDMAIAEACGGFALVQAQLREQFFATLTHDLRGPLGAARINAEFVLRRPNSEQLSRWAARTVENIDRADRMVQNLLDAMRTDAGGRITVQLEEEDLVGIVRQAVEAQASEHGERFVLVAPDPVRGWFAPEPLRRAVENLVGNAVKYGESTRPITISVRVEHGRAMIRVHNHGGAIPVEEQERLFRVFQRLRSGETSGKGGWGLGLAQARGAAEAHGGSILVDSTVERGTTFIIDLPVDGRPFQNPQG